MTLEQALEYAMTETESHVPHFEETVSSELLRCIGATVDAFGDAEQMEHLLL